MIFPYNYDKNRSGLNPIGSFISNTRYARVVASADIDNDDDLDLVFSSGLVLKNNGTGDFGERTNFQLSGQSLAVGDFDGDNDIDIVASQDATLLTFLNDGLGNFQQYFALDVPDKIYKILSGDFDNDGDLDILVFYYNLDVIEVFENFNSPVGIKFESDETYPSSFHLEQNYPNPFNSQTLISYELKQGSNIQLSILNLSGEEVIRLETGYKNQGLFKTIWDGKDKSGKEVSSGIYIAVLKSRDSTHSIKLSLIR